MAAAAVVWCWAEMRAVKWVATLAMIISGSATGTTDGVKPLKFSEKWPSSWAPPNIAWESLTPNRLASSKETTSARSKT